MMLSPNRRRAALITAVMVLAALMPAATPALAFTEDPATVFINEIHYDNAGTDTGEAIEVAGPAGTDLSVWSLVLYNGTNGLQYGTNSIPSPIPDLDNGFGVVVVTYPVNGLQNGSPDGVALVDGGGVVRQFLSYEGIFTAADGPAAGLSSTDIGVAEASSAPAETSLRLIATGSVYQDFDWAGSALSSFGEINVGQSFGDGPTEPPSNECGDPFTSIPQLQGSGDVSPFAGLAVSTEGIVTAVYPNSNLYSIQDSGGDGDARTSDGIFVFEFGAPATVGDSVRLTGTVVEFNGLTEFSRPEVQICGSGSVDPLTLDFTPLTDFEPFEGMLVTAANTFTATDLFNLGRFGEVVLSSNGVDVNPTNVIEPGPAAADSDGDSVADINEPGRIILDDANSAALPFPTPFLAPDGVLRAGDTVDGLTAVVGFGFGAYRLLPVGTVEFAATNPRPDAPEPVGGTISVATFNVLNYFTTIDDGNNGARGADSPSEFERQQAKIVAGILGLGADVVGIEEIENDADVSISALVEALNAADTEGTWAASPTPSYPGGLESTNAIRVGIIYRSNRVTAVGDPIADDDPVFSEDRPPIAQTFDASGEVFTVVVNHFKSKGCSGSTGLDTDQGDGQGCYNARRVAMAIALAEFIDGLSETDPDVISVGDYNSYLREDPIDALEAAGLDNLVERLDPADAYTFSFFGQIGALDNAFVTASLSDRVTGVDIWHINADESRAFDYNDDVVDSGEPGGTSALNPPGLYQPDVYRSSDHDPIIVGFCDAVPPQVAVTVSEPVLWPPDHTLRPITATVDATDNFGEVTVELVSVASDEPDNGTGDGDTPNDIVIESDTSFKLRAERAGDGDGRTYTITYSVTDGCGNTTVASATVDVPRDRRTRP